MSSSLNGPFHLLLFLPVSVVPIVFVLYCAHLFGQEVSDISAFPHEISGDVPFCCFSSAHCSLKKGFMTLLFFGTLNLCWRLFLSPFSSFFILFVKPPLVTTLPSLLFLWTLHPYWILILFTCKWSGTIIPFLYTIGTFSSFYYYFFMFFLLYFH